MKCNWQLKFQCIIKTCCDSLKSNCFYCFHTNKNKQKVKSSKLDSRRDFQVNSIILLLQQTKKKGTLANPF